MCRLIGVGPQVNEDLNRASVRTIVLAVRASLDVTTPLFEPQAKRQVRYVPNLRAPVVTDGYVMVCCRGTAKLIQGYAVGRKPAGFTHHAVIPQYAGYPFLGGTLGAVM
jgi:hypothetical protein